MPNIYELDVSAANNSSTGGQNWAEGQSPGTVNNSARQLNALIAQFLADIGGDLEAGGTANALTVTANSDFTAYADGRMVAFKASADNTAATTLSVNGIGAKAIRKMTSAGEAAIDAGDIINGYTYVVRYSETANSAAGAWLLDWAPKESTLNRVQVGSGMDWWGTTAPSGYIFAYGQAISRTTFAALFAVMGTTYGAGDGSTTFNVPDARGRVRFGKDDMGGVSANRLTDQPGGINGDTLGDVGGAETVALTEAQLAAHDHADTFAVAAGGAHGHSTIVSQDSGAGADTSGGFMLNSGSSTVFSAHTTTPNETAGNQIGLSATHVHSLTGSVSSAGSGEAHNNLPPGIVCNYVIFTGVA